MSLAGWWACFSVPFGAVGAGTATMVLGATLATVRGESLPQALATFGLLALIFVGPTWFLMHIFFLIVPLVLAVLWSLAASRISWLDRSRLSLVLSAVAYSGIGSTYFHLYWWTTPTEVLISFSVAVGFACGWLAPRLLVAELRPGAFADGAA